MKKIKILRIIACLSLAIPISFTTTSCTQKEQPVVDKKEVAIFPDSINPIKSKIQISKELNFRAAVFHKESQESFDVKQDVEWSLMLTDSNNLPIKNEDLNQKELFKIQVITESTVKIILSEYTNDSFAQEYNLHLKATSKYYEEAVIILSTKYKILSSTSIIQDGLIYSPTSLEGIDGYDVDAIDEWNNFIASNYKIAGEINSKPVVKLNSYLFNECTDLTTMDLKTNTPHLLEIETLAFKGCSYLENVTFPQTIKKLSGFYGCHALKSVDIPTSVEIIGGSAFRWCMGLESITIPEGVTSLGLSAFWGCTSMKNVSLPSTLKTIGPQCFLECGSLESITIPEGVTNLENFTFDRCVSLKTVNLPNSLTTINGSAVFSKCFSLDKITLPPNLTKIGVAMFSECISLQAIDIPEGVTTISASAFWECSNLQEVRIPKSVTSIKSSAFYRCINLDVLSYNGSKAEWEGNKIDFDSMWRTDCPFSQVNCNDGTSYVLH